MAKFLLQTPQYVISWHHSVAYLIKQGVALTGRNTTGPPCAAPGELCCTVECYRRRQTPATVTSLAAYTMCRRASDKVNKCVQNFMMLKCARIVQTDSVISRYAQWSPFLSHRKRPL